MNTFLFRPKVPCLIPFWDSISYPTVWNPTLPFTIPVSQCIGTIVLIYNSTPSFFGTQHWPLPFRMGPKPSSLQEETLSYRLCHYWHCWYGPLPSGMEKNNLPVSSQKNISIGYTVIGIAAVTYLYPASFLCETQHSPLPSSLEPNLRSSRKNPISQSAIEKIILCFPFL